MSGQTANAGGSATNSGVRFHQQVGSLISAAAIAEATTGHPFSFDRSTIEWIKFESSAPVDDIVYGTSNDGQVAIQAKTRMTLSKRNDSPFSKTLGQIVRYWLACKQGDGNKGWDRPLSPIKDRIFIVVGPNAPKSITEVARKAFALVDQAPHNGQSAKLQDAISLIQSSVKSHWNSISSTSMPDQLLSDISQLVGIVQVNPDAADRNVALSFLSKLAGEKHAPEVLQEIEAYCGKAMADRDGFDRRELRDHLFRQGFKISAQPAYQKDIARLTQYSDETSSSLRQYGAIIGDEGEPISIIRDCQTPIEAALALGSVLITGEPGAGKSGVLSSIASSLRENGKDVVELAVDRFSIETLEGLRTELGLQHHLAQVLTNWDGAQEGWLIIDALDATRGGPGEAVFRRLIETILKGDSRWNIIASIRSFDLLMGVQFRELFAGAPPVDTLRDSRFPNVRHIQIPTWTKPELDRLLTQTSQLKAAIENAPRKFEELALVPFNTKLLAELVHSNAETVDLKKVKSQSELLAFYWSKKVAAYGLEAEACVKAVLDEMLRAKSLRAKTFKFEPTITGRIETLIKEGVLTSSENRQWVQFRHHLLFDYAVSRTFLYPEDLHLGEHFRKENSLGMMLAPAISFSLDSLWQKDSSRQEYWRTATTLLADASVDPIIRSSIARLCAEFPEVREDIETIGLLLSKEAEKPVVVGAIRHVIGALSVRSSDKSSFSTAPWTRLAELLGLHSSDQLSGSIKVLLYLLEPKTDALDERVMLGEAARSYLRYALDTKVHPTVTSAAIDLVAATIDADVSATVDALHEVLSSDRFQTRGWQEIPTLCRQIKKIIDNAPDFAREIFAFTYASEITEEITTSLGNSQILPMSSTARQDFDMARYALKEQFGHFLKVDPYIAIDALNRSLEGYIKREHSRSSLPETLETSVGHKTVRLSEDLSHIWAHDPDADYLDDAEILLHDYYVWLAKAPADLAVEVAHYVADNSSLACIWARTFLAAVQHPDTDLADYCWSFASKQIFLLSADTRKDAIDLIARCYPNIAEAIKREFEQAALEFDFGAFKHPVEARTRILQRIFYAIGKDHLTTAEAIKIANNAEDAFKDQSANDRPFKVHSYREDASSYSWIEGLNPDEDANAKLINQIDDLKKKFALDGIDGGDALRNASQAVQALSELNRSVREDAHSTAFEDLKRHAQGVLGQCCNETISSKILIAEQDDQVISQFCDVLIELSKSENPEVHAETEKSFERSPSWGGPAARVEAATAILDFILQRPEVYETLKPQISVLLRDPHPAVRLNCAQHLWRIWEIDREAFWANIDFVVENELNLGVLDHVCTHWFGRLLHQHPDWVEPHALRLINRSCDDEDRTRSLKDHMASALAVLWIAKGRPASEKEVEKWISAPASHKTEVTSTIQVCRGELESFAEWKSDANDTPGQRCLTFLAAVLKTTNPVLINSSNITDPSENQINEIRACAEINHDVCMALYFAAEKICDEECSDDETQLTSSFLASTEPLLRLLGAAAPPRSTYYLIKLIALLAPKEPAKAFDLIAYSLLNGGKEFGYQFEAMGADLAVEQFGVLLADNKEIFSDESRREQLVASLDLFMEAGWPSARRLLYRLPELVQ
ncbi:ATP-binding protein [Hyphomonas atlantica corrig.]|uniref:ATP-binding protein n=1 Tax=Hyphomonas atlantica TaxID=1280948 RepID=UPI0023540CC0|nr:ATP-binding protein [Hyphomonas atlantica]